jgi:hypothetical protein
VKPQQPHFAMANIYCSLCSYVASSELQLKSHKFRDHLDHEDAYYCPCCHYPCFGEKGLELHKSSYCPNRTNIVCGVMEPNKGSSYPDRMHAVNTAVEPVTIQIKCCGMCKEALFKKTWVATKNGESYYRTLFLCNKCIYLNPQWLVAGVFSLDKCSHQHAVSFYFYAWTQC